jgi:hypothetical protein
VHPIERLRMVARASGEDVGLVAQEAAAVLAACADDPPSLVTACRRLVDHQPTAGPLWWLAARVLAAADPEEEAWLAADQLERDSTPGWVADRLPDDAVVTVVGWPDQVAGALRRRGDLKVVVVESSGAGGAFAAHLRRADVDVEVAPESGAATAASGAGVVLLEATALGPDGFVASAGSHAAAAVGHHAGVPVWVVAGAGRALPAGLWHALLARLDLERGGRRWDGETEVVPLDLADTAVGHDGLAPAAEAPSWADCPNVPELTRTGSAPGSRRRDRGPEAR